MVLYDAILEGHDGLYVGESSECLGREISEQVGVALVEFGVCSPNERMPSSFDERDYARPGNGHVRLHSRCRRISDRRTRLLYIA